MPRPKSAIPKVTKELSLPRDLVAKVDLALYSELEERVPHAAWQQLLVQLLNDWLEKINGNGNDS